MKGALIAVFGFGFMAALTIVGMGAVTTAVADQVGNKDFALALDDSWLPPQPDRGDDNDRVNAEDRRANQHGRGHGRRGHGHGNGSHRFGIQGGQGGGAFVAPGGPWEPSPLVIAPGNVDVASTNAPAAVNDSGASLSLLAVAAGALVIFRRRVLSAVL